MSDENVCQVCYVPTRGPLTDSVCEDCQEMHDSPYGAAGALVHPFLYAPTTTYQTEFCRVCGKGRDSALHEGATTAAALYETRWGNTAA